ncbi:oleate hydratase [Actinoplanes sp. NPDC049316]|uniref:oleate hydratase n=1 Tax=Actinoplanes sp. NPDC049316 TaxID=3154727 RepID=UPI003443F3D1
MTNIDETHVWIAGGGIAGMAAAAFAVRDAGVPAAHVHILEELAVAGGSLDGGRSPGGGASWVTRGGRMLEEEAYRCTWDLFSSIPSLEDPDVSVRDEIVAFNRDVRTEAKARLIGSGGEVLDASAYGFDALDRLQLTRLLAVPERALGARSIEDMFGEHFFTTNFWKMWRTTFAFQRWHSAAELRRYFLRFVQEFDRLHTLSGVRRTKYDQYDSMVVPLQRWLTRRGVDVRFGVRVVDAEFSDDAGGRRITRLHVDDPHGPSVVELGPHDHALLTLGSITADSTYGDNETVPELIRDRRDGGWQLWERIAGRGADFGDPAVFYRDVDEHKWESFTLTMHGDALLRRIVADTGNEPGTGALMTWVDSGWHLSIVVPHQPHFPDLPPGTFTLWGYGFEIDGTGDHVRKPMASCTGREVLRELAGHLGCDDIAGDLLATTDVTTVLMPYASSLFARRRPGDRPKVVPDRSRNFAFLGQFTELPEDVVFTVEYSVHGAMHAVYRLLGVERPIPPIYHGLLDPKVGVHALEALHR